MTAQTEFQVGTQTYRALLTQHRDTMVDLLVSDHEVARPLAELMIDQLWDRMVAALVKDYPHRDMDHALAELIMNEALGYIETASSNPGLPPSELVDYGWHTFLHYPLEYDVFGKAIAGKAMPHMADDIVFPKGFIDTRPQFSIADTVSAMQAHGPVNELLWVTPGGCDGCCNMRCK